MKVQHKAIILLFVVILAAVAITAQVMPEEITEGIASAINDFRIKLVGRFDHLEYTILKSTKEKPVIYARDDIVRDRVILNDAQGVTEEFLPVIQDADLRQHLEDKGVDHINFWSVILP